MRAAWLLPLLLVSPVMAQSPEDYQDYEDYDDWNMGCAGGVSFDDVNSKTLSYSSCSFAGNQGGGSADFMEMFVSVQGTGQMHMEGFSARGNQQGGSVLAYEMELDILQVVEFVDDGDGKYVPGDDEAVKIYSLDGGWGSFRTSEPEDGGIYFEVDHPIGSGTFTLAATATGSSYSAGGVSVKPLDTKIDFIFSDYRYNDPDSQLALVLHVESEGFSAKGSSFGTNGAVVQSRESGVVGNQGATSLYFTWAKTADVDGVAKPVTSHVDILDSDGESAQGGGGSATFSETEAGITLAYARGTDIVHDPRLGVQFNVKNDSPSLPMVATLAVVGLAMLLRRR